MPLDVARHVISGELQVLNDVLWEWVHLQERYCRLLSRTDVPWWYGERASLGNLAGAVWRTGGITLTEYPTDKEAKEKGTPASRGTRCDLYIRLGRSQFIIEAKYIELSLRSEPQKSIKAILKTAVKDAKRTNSYGAKKLGAVFVAPYVALAHKESMNKRLQHFVGVIESLKPCARAWVFLEKMRNVNPENGKYIYPGTALVIQRR